MSIVYKCKKCTKEYSSYKILWRHDAIKHKTDCQQNVIICQEPVNEMSKEDNLKEGIIIF